MPSAACNHPGLLLLLLRWFCASNMAPRLLLAAVALLLVSPLLPAVDSLEKFTGFYWNVSGATDILESVPDLEKAMYLNVESYPCVRLLNLSGEIGCSSKVSSNPDFARKIAGVLVDSSGYKNKSLGFSPVEKFPQAQFAPYRNLNYEWNPAGSGIMWNHYNFPVFLLSGESTLIIKELAKKNVRSGDAYPVNVAEFDLVMQGSVWSSLPPINVSSTKPPKPILMAVASQDSASFFRDQSLGADSPISGLIALLTAVDALSHVDGLDKLKKQVLNLCQHISALFAVLLRGCTILILEHPKIFHAMVSLKKAVDMEINADQDQGLE
ncbi:putative nicastrin [Cocos nucifera]|uniref:Nicastrin n=1 Tax=Cocos nucifera TaxID=13894 RepID=A0A8K0IGY3_COCNU|nr:putative nicastrin [Cocos nucifera]